MLGSMDERRRALRIHIERWCILCGVTLLPLPVLAQPTASTWWLDSWADLQGWFTTPFLTLGTTNINVVGLLKAAIVVALALAISYTCCGVACAVSASRLPNLDRSAAYTLGRILHYLILVVALFVGLAVIGVDLTKDRDRRRSARCWRRFRSAEHRQQFRLRIDLCYSNARSRWVTTSSSRPVSRARCGISTSVARS